MARRWRGRMWAEGWEALGRGTPVLRHWRRAGGGGGDPDRKPNAWASQERLCRTPLDEEGGAGRIWSVYIPPAEESDRDQSLQ